MHSTSEKELSHLPALDGVRGIAILLVFVTHLRMILGNWPVCRYMEFGWVGVDLFFVLSGFLITRILLQARTQSNYYRRFYIRRGLRIWPLYYLFIALAATALAVVPHLGLYQRLMHPSAYLLETAASTEKVLPLYLLFLQNLFPQASSAFVDYTAITWSLCIEEHFYFLWPVVVRHLNVARLQKLLIGILIASPFARFAVYLAVHDQPYAYFQQIIARSTPFHLDGIAAGCLLSLCWNQWKDPALFRSRFTLWLIVGGATAVTSYLLQDQPVMMAVCYSTLAIFFMSVVALALLGEMKGLLLNPFLRYTGRISYGLYLIHYGVFIIFQSQRLLMLIGGMEHEIRTRVIAATLAVIVSFAIASLSWRYLEQPILSLKDRWAPKAAG